MHTPGSTPPLNIYVLAQEKEISFKVIKVPRTQEIQTEGWGDDTATHKTERERKKKSSRTFFFCVCATVAADRIHRVGAKIRDEGNRHKKKEEKRETLQQQQQPSLSRLNETQSITNRLALVITAV